MNVHCTFTVVHTNLEIYQTVVEFFCIHSTVSLHLNYYVAAFQVVNVKIKLYLADKLKMTNC